MFIISHSFHGWGVERWLSWWFWLRISQEVVVSPVSANLQCSVTLTGGRGTASKVAQRLTSWCWLLVGGLSSALNGPLEHPHGIVAGFLQREYPRDHCKAEMFFYDLAMGATRYNLYYILLATQCWSWFHVGRSIYTRVWILGCKGDGGYLAAWWPLELISISCNHENPVDVPD